MDRAGVAIHDTAVDGVHSTAFARVFCGVLDYGCDVQGKRRAAEADSVEERAEAWRAGGRGMGTGGARNRGVLVV